MSPATPTRVHMHTPTLSISLIKSAVPTCSYFQNRYCKRNMSTHQYVSFTTDFYKTPWLGKLPLSVKEGTKTYDVSKYVPANATEILVYLFVTVCDSKGPTVKRSVYD